MGEMLTVSAALEYSLFALFQPLLIVVCRAEAEVQVQGFPNAAHQRFSTRAEALAFMAAGAAAAMVKDEKVKKEEK